MNANDKPKFKNALHTLYEMMSQKQKKQLISYAQAMLTEDLVEKDLQIKNPHVFAPFKFEL